MELHNSNSVRDESHAKFRREFCHAAWVSLMEEWGSASDSTSRQSNTSDGTSSIESEPEHQEDSSMSSESTNVLWCEAFPDDCADDEDESCNPSGNDDDSTASNTTENEEEF
jgi:hypothetical protein